MADDSLSDEDKALFRAHMRAVKPLNKGKFKVQIPASTTLSDPVNKPREMRKREVKPEELQSNQKKYYLSDFIADTVLSEAILSYSHPRIPNQNFNALKKGLIPWEARLDLHGLHTEAARESLSEFITLQIQRNKKCVLIIHGKGGQEGTPPRIKNLVNRWLPQFEEVLAFHSALAKDGGSGAVYVLLKSVM